MFATLAGGLPVPPAAADDDAAGDGERAAGETPLHRVVEDQRALGLEPISDGLLEWPEGAVVGTALALGGRLVPARSRSRGSTGAAAAAVRFTGRPRPPEPRFVERWRATAALAAPAAAKVVVGGPYSIAALAAAEPSERARLAHELAEVLNAELLDLEAAGCPFVQIDEPAAATIGRAPVERRRFVEAEARLLAGLSRLHPSLAILGGSADGAGPATIFEAPYRSYLFDLVAGPDNWYLVAAAPGDRGIICGVVPGSPSLGPVGVEVLVFAAQYAASMNGRGGERVGLASAGTFSGLSYAEALARMRLLADGARAAAAIAAGDREAARRWLDRRSWDMRAGGRPRRVAPDRRDRRSPASDPERP